MSNRFHARLAAAALLKMAKATVDPELAAHFVRLAANLKDHTGELQTCSRNRATTYAVRGRLLAPRN
jgi:hypothetical protein